jgi:hypothetical protein
MALITATTPSGRTHAADSRRDEAFQTSQLAAISPRLLGSVAIVAGGAGMLATQLTSPAVQATLLMVFMSVGVGSAVMCWINLPVGATIAGTVGLSIAAVSGVASQMVHLRQWHPSTSCFLLAAVVTIAGVVRLRTLRDGDSRGCHAAASVSPRDSTVGSTRRLCWPAAVLLVVALGAWVVALPRLPHADVGQYGLLASSGGVLLLIAAGMAITAFVMAIVAEDIWTAITSLAIVVVVQRITVTLITDVPIYAWTYKHIAVVDYIAENGQLYHPSIDIYRHWPGFFSSMAWFSSITGMDPVDIAHWFTPAADVLILTMVAALALALGLTKRSALTASMIAQLANWIGQDYYSPQALALVMAISILALLVSSKGFRIAGYLSVLVFAVFVATHQLTPVWVCALAVAMTMIGLVRPWWLPGLYLLVVAVYLPPRLPYIQQYGWFTGFNPLENSDPAAMTSDVAAGAGTDVEKISAGREFTTIVEQGLSMTLWLAAALCFLIVWRGAHRRWAAPIIAFSPMVLLFGQSYGGEAILRVYLYSLAGCALLVAPLVVRLLTRQRRRRRFLSVAVVWLVLLGVGAAGMQGYFGAWSYITITRSQLDHARWLSETSPAGSVVISSGAPAGWPGRSSADYIRHALVDPWYDNQFDERQDLPFVPDSVPEALKTFERESLSTGLPVYVVLPRQSWIYEEYMRSSRTATLDAIVDDLDRRSGWIRVIDDGDSLVFGYGRKDRRQ